MTVNCNSSELPSVTHVIFDLDGTLIDSETCGTKAINEVTMRYGKEFDEQLQARAIGSSLPKFGPIIIKELNLPLTHESFTDQVVEQFDV